MASVKKLPVLTENNSRFSIHSTKFNFYKAPLISFSKNISFDVISNQVSTDAQAYDASFDFFQFYLYFYSSDNRLIGYVLYEVSVQLALDVDRTAQPPRVSNKIRVQIKVRSSIESKSNAFSLDIDQSGTCFSDN